MPEQEEKEEGRYKSVIPPNPINFYGTKVLKNKMVIC
jgi:hypothetical protein